MKKKTDRNTIALNKKALHEYFIEEKIIAGIALEGWEVKSLKAGKLQLVDSYVTFRDNELWLLGGRISPLITASSHKSADPTRTKKLLLHHYEINKLSGKISKKGYTLVALSFFWKKCWVKVELALVKGKKQHDKRATIKEREWNREKNRILKRGL